MKSWLLCLCAVLTPVLVVGAEFSNDEPSPRFSERESYERAYESDENEANETEEMSCSDEGTSEEESLEDDLSFLDSEQTEQAAPFRPRSFARATRIYVCTYEALSDSYTGRSANIRSAKCKALASCILDNLLLGPGVCSFLGCR